MQISIVRSLFLNFDNTHDKGTTVSPEFTRNSTIESYRSVGSSAGKERGEERCNAETSSDCASCFNFTAERSFSCVA